MFVEKALIIPHYADDSNGVCIVLDRDSLLEVNKNRLEHVFYKLEDIEYTWNHSPSLKVSEEKYSSVSEFVQKNYRELFLRRILIGLMKERPVYSWSLRKSI